MGVNGLLVGFNGGNGANVRCGAKWPWSCFLFISLFFLPPLRVCGCDCVFFLLLLLFIFLPLLIFILFFSLS